MSQGDEKPIDEESNAHAETAMDEESEASQPPGDEPSVAERTRPHA